MHHVGGKAGVLFPEKLEPGVRPGTLSPASRKGRLGRDSTIQIREKK